MVETYTIHTLWVLGNKKETPQYKTLKSLFFSKVARP
jgi:hypothetical protein